MKKVILLLVDSLMPHVLDACFQQKTVPALQFLKDRGRYWPNCVTVFPTMTASVDCSLVTGVYPDRHRVPGLLWYDPEEKTIVNYINGVHCVRKIGLSKCAKYVLFDLNEKHLSKDVTTVFEELHERGCTSASVNAVVHRGHRKHRLRLHALPDWVTRSKLRGEISGPDVMTMGATVQNPIHSQIPPKLFRAGRKYGINDDYAVAAVKNMIESGAQPDFILVYLPDNDHEVHRKNPDHAEDILIRVDGKIQDILNTYTSWDEALKQTVFIVISDHGQTRMGKGPEFTIDLDRLLEMFHVLQLGEPFRGHELAIANNERMVYLYPMNPHVQEKTIKQVSQESRIDIIAWKEKQGVRVREGGSGREIYYRKGSSYLDVYGNSWSISGEWQVLDLLIKDGKIQYGDYPDVLSRLYGALYSQDIPMIVLNARPRYEFKARYFPMHSNGGCHGSLHKYDSLIPLIIAGSDIPIKEPPRLIDMKNYILELFDGYLK